jgi:hypothetical protein
MPVAASAEARRKSRIDLQALAELAPRRSEKNIQAQLSMIFMALEQRGNVA